VKIVLKDLRKEFQSSEREKEKFSDLIREMKKSEKFLEIKEEPKDQKMTKNSKEKVKKEIERNFLFLPFESPKMPKSIKREVTKKKIKAPKLTKFSKHQCKICQKYLSNTASLNRHTELHFQPSSFECKKCQKVWKMKGYFDAHKCVKKSERHFCSFCEKNYSNIVQLRNHVKICHDGKLNDLFCCDFCGENFLIKGFLKNHLETFKCRKVFTCDHCGKEFHVKNKIYRHLRSHKTETIQCKICPAQIKLSNWN
jgi:hypothetical protein